MLLEPIHKASPDDIEIGHVLASNYGNLASSLDDINQAIRYYQKAIVILITMNSQDNSNISNELAATYNNIGGAYLKKGKYDKAIEYYEKANDILKDFVSEDHPNMKTLLANYEYAKKKKKEEAGL